MAVEAVNRHPEVSQLLMEFPASLTREPFLKYNPCVRSMKFVSPISERFTTASGRPGALTGPTDPSGATQVGVAALENDPIGIRLLCSVSADPRKKNLGVSAEKLNGIPPGSQ